LTLSTSIPRRKAISYLEINTGLMETESSVRERILKILERCERRLQKDPEDLDALFSKGLSLARLKEYNRALYCLNQVTKIKSNYPCAWRLKATVYSLIGDRWMFRLCKEVADRLEETENASDIEWILATTAA